MTIRPTKTFTDEQEQEIRRRNHNGESITTLSKAYGVGRKTIENALKRAGGAKDRTGSYIFKVDECKELRSKLEAGSSTVELEKELGHSRSAISRAIKQVGGKTKSGLRPGPRIFDERGYSKIMVYSDDEIGWAMAQSVNYRNKTKGAGCYVLEHRLVMARMIGRALLPHETVHHKDGNRSNNLISNLELRAGPHGKGATHEHCTTCRCFEEYNKLQEYLNAEQEDQTEYSTSYCPGKSSFFWYGIQIS